MNDQLLGIIIPDPSKKAKSNTPVDRTTRRKSARNRSNGTAIGSRYSMTIEYAGASQAMIPRLLAASPTRMLTNDPLNALPTFVFSDLQTQITITHIKTTLFELLNLIPKRSREGRPRDPIR